MTSRLVIEGTVVAKGVMWRVMEVVGSETLAFGSFVVLAWLLIPEDFGVVSQATLLIVTMQLVLHQGLPEALVQKQDLGAAHFDTAFWTNLVLGGLTMVALIVVADLVAAALAEPVLGEVLRWLAPTLVLFAAGRVILAKLRRELRFQGFMLMSITATLAGAVAGIALAAAGFGIWSLVAQQWVHAAVGLGMAWLYSGWVPQPRFAWHQLRDLWAFSSFTIVDSLLRFSTRRLDLLILAVFWSATEIGYYFLANRLLFSAGMLTYYSMSHLGLPILAKLTVDSASHREAIYRTFRLVSLGCLPTLVGLGLVASPMIPLLFGVEWVGSVAPFQMLCAFSIFYALALMSGQVLLSAGHARDSMALSGVNVILFLLAVTFAAPYGLTAAALAGGVANMLATPIYLKVLQRRFGIDLRRMLKEQIPAWLATLGMAVVVLWGQQLLAGAVAPWGILALSITVGAGVFITIILVLAHAEMREIYFSFAHMWQGRDD